MTPLRSWSAAARPGQALLAPFCAAVGGSYAHFDARQGPGLPAHVILILGAFAAGLGVNLVDLAWERLGEPPPNPVSPGPESLPPVDALAYGGAGVAAIVLAALCGFGLVPLSGSGALGYGALAVMLGVARGAPLVGLAALDWRLGQLVSYLAVGPLAAMAGFASQTGAGSFGAFLAGLPAGLVAMTALVAGRDRIPGLDADRMRRIAIALPLLAIAAVAVAVRAGEYGTWAYAATAPLLVSAAAAWRAPTSSDAQQRAPVGRLTLGCAIVALACIVVALRIGSPE